MSTEKTQRDEIIAGLRELADWLEANPEVPARRDLTMRYSVSNSQSDDEASLAELHRLAALIGVDVVDTRGGHFDAVRRFRGGVRYEAGVILRQTMVDHNEVFRLGREALEAQRAGEAPDA